MKIQIKIKKTFLCFLIPIFFSSLGQAFQDKSFGLGLGYFSQNILNKTAQSPSGSTKFLGETSYPFLFSYDFAISSTWFLTPRLGYTLLPRSTPWQSS